MQQAGLSKLLSGNETTQLLNYPKPTN
uniref:Uncharacterized protein n=1 Tax=Anguilla anguilla TaxID=7936 RepID=A0A0E9UDV6_ANGAN